MTRLRATDTELDERRSAAHFAMIEKQALANLDVLMRENFQAARLILSLIRFLDPGTGGVVVISKQTMAEMMGVSESTIARSLKVLIEGKWIQRIRIGSAHALAVNDTVAWVGARSDRQFASFSAVVVASRSEQDKNDLTPGDLRKLPIANLGEDVIEYGEADPPAQGLIPGSALTAVTDQALRDELEKRGQQRIPE